MKLASPKLVSRIAPSLSSYTLLSWNKHTFHLWWIGLDIFGNMYFVSIEQWILCCAIQSFTHAEVERCLTRNILQNKCTSIWKVTHQTYWLDQHTRTWRQASVTFTIINLQHVGLLHVEAMANDVRTCWNSRCTPHGYFVNQWLLNDALTSHIQCLRIATFFSCFFQLTQLPEE